MPTHTIVILYKKTSFSLSALTVFGRSVALKQKLNHSTLHLKNLPTNIYQKHFEHFNQEQLLQSRNQSTVHCQNHITQLPNASWSILDKNIKQLFLHHIWPMSVLERVTHKGRYAINSHLLNVNTIFKVYLHISLLFVHFWETSLNDLLEISFQAGIISSV